MRDARAGSSAAWIAEVIRCRDQTGWDAATSGGLRLERVITVIMEGGAYLAIVATEPCCWGEGYTEEEALAASLRALRKDYEERGRRGASEVWHLPLTRRALPVLEKGRDDGRINLMCPGDGCRERMGIRDPETGITTLEPGYTQQPGPGVPLGVFNRPYRGTPWQPPAKIVKEAVARLREMREREGWQPTGDTAEYRREIERPFLKVYTVRPGERPRVPRLDPVTWQVETRFRYAPPEVLDELMARYRSSRDLLKVWADERREPPGRVLVSCPNCQGVAIVDVP